jgi:hypothetical protein
MRGGRQMGGPVLKRLMSRTAGLSLYYLVGFPTHDCTNSFRLYDAALVNDLGIQSSGGFELALELTAKAFRRGVRIAEVPTTGKGTRTSGESRFRLLPVVSEVLVLAWPCFGRPLAPPQRRKSLMLLGTARKIVNSMSTPQPPSGCTRRAGRRSAVRESRGPRASERPPCRERARRTPTGGIVLRQHGPPLCFAACAAYSLAAFDDRLDESRCWMLTGFGRRRPR